jgi:hypothetical protein
MVAHCLASSSGSRRPTEATFMPNFSRQVAPASAAITLMHSSMGSRDTRVSVCQRESMPPSSHICTQRQKPLAPSNGEVARPVPTATPMSVAPP